jgi:hypothetical protein
MVGTVIIKHQVNLAYMLTAETTCAKRPTNQLRFLIDNSWPRAHQDEKVNAYNSLPAWQTGGL